MDEEVYNDVSILDEEFTTFSKASVCKVEGIKKCSV